MALGYLTEAEFDAAVVPENMAKPYEVSDQQS